MALQFYYEDCHKKVLCKCKNLKFCDKLPVLMFLFDLSRTDLIILLRYKLRYAFSFDCGGDSVSMAEVIMMEWHHCNNGGGGDGNSSEGIVAVARLW